MFASGDMMLTALCMWIPVLDTSDAVASAARRRRD